MRRIIRLLLVLFVIPTIIGAVVMAAGGRPLAYELLQRGTSYRFPDVDWIVTKDLARWMEDRTRPQPVLLDARTDTEFAVSQLQGARRIEPSRPSLNVIAGFPKDTPIVVYSSAGYRGALVAAWLEKQGYRKVQNLGSSLYQWVNEGRPIYHGATPVNLVHPYDGQWGWLVEREYRARVPNVRKESAAP
jgi:rhodanese-related sulfurtransferase